MDKKKCIKYVQTHLLYVSMIWRTEVCSTHNSLPQKIINKNGITIKENDQKFSIDDFRKKFNLAFCIIVYKYQGAEIDQHYNIFDTEAMNKKQIYTSLSRTTKFKTYTHII